jgi:hypothetical protein
VSDKNKPSSTARAAGRGFGWMLEKLLGRGGVAKLAESADVLRREYQAGKREREEQPPRAVPHRELESEAGAAAPPDPEDS